MEPMEGFSIFCINSISILASMLFAFWIFITGIKYTFHPSISSIPSIKCLFWPIFFSYVKQPMEPYGTLHNSLCCVYTISLVILCAVNEILSIL